MEPNLNPDIPAPSLNADPAPPTDPKGDPKPPQDPAVQFSNIFSKGLNEGRQRERQQFVAAMQALGIGITEDDPISGIKAAFEEVNQRKGAMKGAEEEYKTQLANTKAELEKTKAERKTYEVNQAILWSVAKHPVVDPEAVRALFATQYKVDSTADGIRVYQPNGRLAFNKSAEEMTLDEAIASFLDERPFLVKSNARPGVGAEPKKGDPADMIAEYKNPHTSQERKAEILKLMWK
jgi:hypothetical protein